MKLTVGTNTIGYAEKRNFADLPFKNYEIVKKQNLNKLPAHLYFKLTNKTHQYLWNTFTDLNFHGVSLFHFFNALSTGKTPWVTTFETFLPRWGDKKSMDKGLRLIANEPCKKIIALSECTANIQQKIIQDNNPEYVDVINEKLIVIHPPQRLLVDSYEDKKLSNEEINLTLIGNDFFRKGGKEVLEVIVQLRDSGHPIKLHIISSLDTGDYASKATQEDKTNALKIIKSNSNFIKHYINLENEKVLDILKSSHIALLPTYADTYGYSVLEAQAAGCPVITTDIRALPEINNDEVGWLINVPKNDIGNALLFTENERMVLSKLIKEQLMNIMEDILSNPEQLKIKSQNCIKRIQEKHSFTGVTEEIEDIYNDIINNS